MDEGTGQGREAGRERKSVWDGDETLLATILGEKKKMYCENRYDVWDTPSAEEILA